MLKQVAAMTAISCLAASAAIAAPEDIKFPKNYDSEFLNYVSLDRANGKQAGRLYANSIAINGVKKDGNFPNGSVLLMEVSKVKKGPDGKPLKSTNGRFIRAGKAAIVVMQKINGIDKNIPAELRNDNWEFAVFSPSGKFLKKNTNACRACHAPLKAQRHVFSYDHLQKANLKDYLIRTASNQAAGVNNQKVVQKVLDSVEVVNPKLVNKVLGSISTKPEKPKRKKVVRRKSKNLVNRLLGSISTPGDKKKKPKRTAKVDNRNVNKLLSSIQVPDAKNADFAQNLEIKSVITQQLIAFRQNRANTAYSFAAPSIKSNFQGSRNFMAVVRNSYPSVYFAKKAVFPPMKKISGTQHLQKVVLIGRNGRSVVAQYLMIKVGGTWKIGGVDVSNRNP